MGSSVSNQTLNYKRSNHRVADFWFGGFFCNCFMVAASVALLSPLPAHALPVGNPSEASLFTNGLCFRRTSCDFCDPYFSLCDAWSLRIGFYGDWVFNRHMEVSHRDNDEDPGADINRTQINTNAGYIALNFCNRFDAFATLGATNMHIRTDDSAWDPVITSDATSGEPELTFQPHFSWSVGGRATLWECGCLAVGVEGQYFRFRPHLNYFLSYNDGDLTYLNDAPRATYQEWQGGVGLSYRFTTHCSTVAMVPYVAVQRAGSKLKLNDFELSLPSVDFTFRNLRSKKAWGFAVGTSLTLCNMVGVTVEGRWAGEKALYVNGQLRF